MRTQTREYLQKFLETHKVKSVLDVGSLNVTGEIRDLFKDGIEFVGLDMRGKAGEGNVDIVGNAHDIKDIFPDKKFDLVCCFDTMEHDDKFWETVENLRWVTKPGGWLFIGVPSRFCPEHDHPHDFWRFMPQAMGLFLEGYENIETVVDKGDNGQEDEVYGYGQKP
jgi:SAM-dependent methyltransferase